MNLHKKVIFFWILIILWCLLIFFFSNMNTIESNSKSKLAINKILTKSFKITNKLGITNINPIENKVNKITEKLNKPIRKLAHASEYFILTILIILVLRISKIEGAKIYFITLIFCFLYACGDEYHQKFVDGRTSKFLDSLIDTSGSLLGCIIVMIKTKITKYKEKV